MNDLYTPDAEFTPGGQFALEFLVHRQELRTKEQFLSSDLVRFMAYWDVRKEYPSHAEASKHFFLAVEALATICAKKARGMR